MREGKRITVPQVSLSVPQRWSVKFTGNRTENQKPCARQQFAQELGHSCSRQSAPICHTGFRRSGFSKAAGSSIVPAGLHERRRARHFGISQGEQTQLPLARTRSRATPSSGFRNIHSFQVSESAVYPAAFFIVCLYIIPITVGVIDCCLIF